MTWAPQHVFAAQLEACSLVLGDQARPSFRIYPCHMGPRRSGLSKLLCCRPCPETSLFLVKRKPDMGSPRGDQSEEVLPLISAQDSLQVQDKQSGSSAHFERDDDASRARMALYASHAMSTWGQRMWVRTPGPCATCRLQECQLYSFEKAKA